MLLTIDTLRAKLCLLMAAASLLLAAFALIPVHAFGASVQTYAVNASGDKVFIAKGAAVIIDGTPVKMKVKGLSKSGVVSYSAKDSHTYSFTGLDYGTVKVRYAKAGKTYSSASAMPTFTIKVKKFTLNRRTLVSYPGRETQLRLDDATHAKWKSTNSKVAEVNENGLITGVAGGRCYVKVKTGGTTLKCLVEVCSYKAYQAVHNAYIDMHTNIAYSQSQRMEKYYRDCSSFTSRCYWDPSLGRKLFYIGEDSTLGYALDAASQAKWLNKHGKRVGYKAVSINKLRPGDLIYYYSTYSSGGGYRGINHAAMYVGNGHVMDGTGTGGVGTVGYRAYDYGEGSADIRFIGRPCP